MFFIDPHFIQVSCWWFNFYYLYNFELSSPSISVLELLTVLHKDRNFNHWLNNKFIYSRYLKTTKLHISSLVQRGFEIRPFEIRKHLKSGLFKGQILYGQVFKWLGFSYGYSLKNRTILSGFEMIFWQNGNHLSVFQMVGLLDFRSHSNSRPFPVFNWKKTKWLLLQF